MNLLAKNKDYSFKYMLPKESENVLGMKKLYGYYSTQLLNDFDRVRNLNAEKHKSQFIKLSEKLSEIITNVRKLLYNYIKIHLSWVDLISYYSDVYDNPKKTEN